MHKFTINNYEHFNTIFNSTKVNHIDLILILLAFKYEKKEKNLKLKEKLKKKFEEINCKITDKVIKEKYKKYYENELSEVVNSIIYLIINLVIRDFPVKAKDQLNDNLNLGEITQDKLVLNLGESLIRRAPKILPKGVLDSNKKWNDEEKTKIKDYYKFLVEEITEETKGAVGNNLFELILDKVDIIQRKDTFIFNNKKHIRIIINPEYFQLLYDNLSNPLRLPLLSKPKEINNIKDNIFLTSRYNKIINNNLIHFNKKNTEKSIIYDNQIATINYLNNQNFKINNNILKLLLKEFKVKNSIIFISNKSTIKIYWTSKIFKKIRH